jgi:hypothetical protein
MHPGRQFEWKQVLDSELDSKSTWFQPPPGWILEIQIVSAILIDFDFSWYWEWWH